MATLLCIRPRGSATIVLGAALAGLGTQTASPAQAAHPFAPARTVPAFSLSPTAAFADVNRDGSMDAIVPGVFFGTTVTTLDEHGNSLAANGPGPLLGPVPRAPTWPNAIAMAAGRLDGDALEDLIVVAGSGSVHFLRNLGNTGLLGSRFAADVVIDAFFNLFPISPPFLHYSFPVARVVDLDLDGHQDVLIAGGPHDRWGAATLPGFIGYYRGDGAGGFEVSRVLMPGSVVDVEIADLDNDGSPDGLVALVENGAMGGFSNDLVHLVVQQGALSIVGYPQNVGPGRLVALEIADVIGDANNDYIVAQVSAGGGSVASQIYFFAGDGQGQVSSSVWCTFALPANLTGLGDFVSSIQVADFDRDSHPDIAVLRGFVLSSSGSPPTATFANAEVLVAMGPNLALAPFERIPLPGYAMWSSTFLGQFAMLPVTAQPDGLRAIDLGRDGSLDFAIAGLRPLTAASAPVMATLRNTTPAAAGEASFEKVGSPTGCLPSRPARIGFDGGRPVLGNADFACTIQNVQDGAIVGLMWGSYPTASLFQSFGFHFHFAPELFGYAAVATGTGATDGFYSYPLPIPPLPALLGDAGCFQYNYWDPVVGAFGGTQATRVCIGN